MYVWYVCMSQSLLLLFNGYNVVSSIYQLTQVASYQEVDGMFGTQHSTVQHSSNIYVVYVGRKRKKNLALPASGIARITAVVATTAKSVKGAFYFIFLISNAYSSIVFFFLLWHQNRNLKSSLFQVSLCEGWRRSFPLPLALHSFPALPLLVGIAIIR
ncbi:hypothetical protein F4778DRAFT_561503 [Xylariomycetidae sp. FL2044]|nr:hypothetical protein F4778DRAFT_561503 [Xylariomycetidae sp. FL2044]